MPRRSRYRANGLDVHPENGGCDLCKDCIAIMQEIPGDSLSGKACDAAVTDVIGSKARKRSETPV
jgi:hypothetical protein